MKRLWSLIIWRTLITPQHHAPGYARAYWHAYHRKASQQRRTTSQRVLNCAYVTGFVIMATPCGWIGCFTLVAFTSFESLPMALATASSIASLSGIGAAILASQTAGAIRRLQQQNLLDHWLLLPYPRHELVLYGITPAYEPAIFQLGLGITEIVALLFGGLALYDVLQDIARGIYDNPFGVSLMALVAWGVLLGLLVIEWIQWMALSVALGVVAGSARRLGVPAAILYGMAVAVLRGAGGLLIAISLDMPVKWIPLAIITGPLSGIVATPRNMIGILAGLIYLVGLEWIVRWAFARAVNRIGEG